MHHTARPLTLPAATCDDVSHTILPALERALLGQGPPITPLGSGPDIDGIRAALAPQRPLEAEGIAAVLPTSGSTGEPKLALLGADALQASARATLERLGGPGGWLLALPVTRVAGLQVLVRSLLAGTSPEILPTRAEGRSGTGRSGEGRAGAPAKGAGHSGTGRSGFAEAFVAGTRRLRGRGAARLYTALVPTQLTRLLQAGGAATEALTCYDGVLLGGGPTAPALRSAAVAAGARIVTTYGMTETCGGCVYDGRPLRDVQVRLDDDGRVRIAGPVLFSGYRGRPELTAEALRDGWLRTQDLGRLDSSGRLELIGRVDDVVVSGGVNVPLPAVDAALCALPGVAEAAACGVPDPEWGTKVVAYLVPRPDARPPGLEEVREGVAASCPRAYAPKEVYVVDRLPLLPSGKLDRAALRPPPAS